MYLSFEQLLRLTFRDVSVLVVAVEHVLCASPCLHRALTRRSRRGLFVVLAPIPPSRALPSSFLPPAATICCTHLHLVLFVRNLFLYFFYQGLNPKVRKGHPKTFLNYPFGIPQSCLLPRYADLHREISTHSLLPMKKESI